MENKCKCNQAETMLAESCVKRDWVISEFGMSLRLNNSVKGNEIYKISSNQLKVSSKKKTKKSTRRELHPDP